MFIPVLFIACWDVKNTVEENDVGTAQIGKKVKVS
jgi:hypothetical protein